MSRAPVPNKRGGSRFQRFLTAGFDDDGVTFFQPPPRNALLNWLPSRDCVRNMESAEFVMMANGLSGILIFPGEAA